MAEDRLGEKVGLFFRFVKTTADALWTFIVGLHPVFLFVPLAAIGFTVWAFVHFVTVARLERISLDWDPRRVLVLWIAIGVAAGAAAHCVFSIFGRWLPHHESRARHHEIASHFVGVIGVV
jgi:hypothetical protein